MWLSLVERYVRDVEVASSNLVTPISFTDSSESVFLFPFSSFSFILRFLLQITGFLAMIPVEQTDNLYYNIKINGGNFILF